jgi:hypothetical protein
MRTFPSQCNNTHPISSSSSCLETHAQSDPRAIPNSPSFSRNASSSLSVRTGNELDLIIGTASRLCVESPPHEFSSSATISSLSVFEFEVEGSLDGGCEAEPLPLPDEPDGMVAIGLERGEGFTWLTSER